MKETWFCMMQSLDRIKCRLLEGTNAQEVRAMVLDMQARLLLDMLGKGIESALLNPSALVSEPWNASGEMLSGIDPEAMAVEPALVLSIQVSPCSIPTILNFHITCCVQNLFLHLFVFCELTEILNTKIC